MAEGPREVAWGGRPAAIALALLAVVAFLPALAGEWIWDDGINVTGSPAIADPAGLLRIWCEPGATQQWYPVTHTTYWIEHALFGFRPAVFHATSLLVHALAAVLLLRLLLRLGFPGPAAWIGAALWAVHPVQAESVAWITERRNVLSMAFALGAALHWLRWAGLAEDGAPGEGRRGAWAAATLLGAAAILAKSAVAPLPPALLVLAWWKRGRVDRRDVLSLLPLAAVAVGAGLLTLRLERGLHWGAGPGGFLDGPVDRLANAGKALWFYAATLLRPTALVPVYPRWEAGEGLLRLLPAAAAAALPVAAVALRGRLGRGPAAALLLFGGILFPVLGFLDVAWFLYSFVADRFLYHASPALLAPAALGLVRLGEEVGRRRPGLARLPAAAVLLALAALSFRQAGVYRDTLTLWTSTVERNPRAWVAWLGLGNEAMPRGLYAEAEIYFGRCLALRGDLPETWHHRAVCLMETGRFAEAEAAYGRVAELRPGDASGPEGAGMARLALERPAEAEACFRAALARDPDRRRARLGLVGSLHGQGRVEEAAAEAREGWRRWPQMGVFADALATLLPECATVRERAGDGAGAAAALDEALALPLPEARLAPLRARRAALR